MGLMEVKNCNLVKTPCCKETDTVHKIASDLKKSKQRSILVTHNSRPIGIISAVDIVNKVVASGKSPKATKAKDIMNKVCTVDAKENVATAYFAMAKKGFMSCPVVDNNRYVGTLQLHEAIRYITQKSKQ